MNVSQCLGLLLGLGLTSPALSNPADDADSRSGGPEVVLQLPPSPTNPRNSEGAFVELADGRLLFIYTHFTGGGSDHAAAHLASRISEDGGKTWSEADDLVLPNEGGQNVMSVSLLRLADGDIGLIYLRKNSLSDCRPWLRTSQDEGKTWSEPIEMISEEELGYYVLNNDRIIQLENGRLIAPVALHAGAEGKWHPGIIHCYLSDDNGQTWKRNRQPIPPPFEDTKGLMEPGVVELEDGTLFMVIRTRVGCQYTARSADGGETWTDLQPSETLLSPESPATVKRIPQTGDLLLVWNDHRERSEEDRKERPQARTPLVAVISKDGGKTWTNPKTIEGSTNHGYCYMAMTFVGDRVLLAYCAGELPSILAKTQISSIDLDWLIEP